MGLSSGNWLWDTLCLCSTNEEPDAQTSFVTCMKSPSQWESQPCPEPRWLTLMQCPRCSRNSHPPTSVLGRTMSSGGGELLHCTGGLSKPQWGAAYQDSMCTAPLSQTQGSFPTRQNKQEGQHASEQTYEIEYFQTHFTHKETGSGKLRENHPSSLRWAGGESNPQQRFPSSLLLPLPPCSRVLDRKTDLCLLTTDAPGSLIDWLPASCPANCPHFFYLWLTRRQGLPKWFSGKESACQCGRHRRCRFNPWVRKIP